MRDLTSRESDRSLFKRVLNDTYHLLNCLLPDERHYCCNLRDRAQHTIVNFTSRQDYWTATF